MNTKKFTLTAMFTALVCVATMVIHIPAPNGYINMGDAVLLLSAFLLGPLPGAICGGLGSCLADIFLSFAAYSPATFIIKFIMGYIAGAIVRKKSSFLSTVVAAVIAEVIMVLGYFLFEAFILKLGISVFFVSIPGNLMQSLGGIIISVILFSVLKKNKYIVTFTK